MWADAVCKKDCCQVVVPIFLDTTNVHRYKLAEGMIETFNNPVGLRVVSSRVYFLCVDEIAY